MSKELEVLEKFLDDYLTLCEKLHTNRQEKMLLDKNSPYNVLKTYLESIDNANPSEALEEIKTLRGFNQVELNNDENVNKSLDIIEQALLKAQEPKQYVDELKLVEKSLNALEIIKEKYPDVVEVKLCKDYEHYKLRMSSKHDTEIVKIDWNDKSLLDYLLLLTEEEFDLLKEVLE